MTGYSGTLLSKKLGLEEGQRIRFVGAPDHFCDLIGPLPPGSEMTDGLSGTLDLAVMFAGSQQVLENGLGEIAARLAPNGALWVAWPKKSSGVATDLDFEAVQRTGLDAGLVDNKVCAIDETWSGLRFVFRVGDRPATGGQRPHAKIAPDRERGGMS